MSLVWISTVEGHEWVPGTQLYSLSYATLNDSTSLKVFNFVFLPLKVGICIVYKVYLEYSKLEHSNSVSRYTKM